MEISEISEILESAREIIRDPNHWVVGALCAGEDPTHIVSYSSPEATKFCAVGAVYRVGYVYLGDEYGGNNAAELARIWLDSTAYSLFSMAAHHVNDKLGHESVMSLYDEAIERAKRGEETHVLPI